VPERRVPVLTDPEVSPDDALIEAALATAAPAWRHLGDLLGASGLGLELSWRHYRDGGWLCPAIRGGKNVAWLAVWDGYATVTCYFAERHRPGPRGAPRARGGPGLERRPVRTAAPGRRRGPQARGRGRRPAEVVAARIRSR